MPPRSYHRIDSAHAAVSEPIDEAAGKIVRTEIAAGARSIAKAGQLQSGAAATLSPADTEPWLRAHASDLIAALKKWGQETDDREARLNARIAIHERSERQFRVQRCELLEQIAQTQARMQQLQDEMQRRARRLAFTDPA